MYTPLDLNAKQEANLNEGLKAAIEAKEGKGAPAQMGYDAPVNQAIIDPMTGVPMQQGEMTNVPPQQYNTMGNATPVFSKYAQLASEKINGGIQDRQNSVFATPMFKKNCNKKY
jgi:hypothetical protein